MRWVLAFLLCWGLLLIGLPLCQATVPLPPQNLRLELNFAADKSGWGSLQIYLPADSTEKPDTFLSFFQKAPGIEPSPLVDHGVGNWEIPFRWTDFSQGPQKLLQASWQESESGDTITLVFGNKADCDELQVNVPGQIDSTTGELSVQTVRFIEQPTMRIVFRLGVTPTEYLVPTLAGQFRLENDGSGTGMLEVMLPPGYPKTIEEEIEFYSTIPGVTAGTPEPTGEYRYRLSLSWTDFNGFWEMQTSSPQPTRSVLDNGNIELQFPNLELWQKLTLSVSGELVGYEGSAQLSGNEIVLEGPQGGSFTYTPSSTVTTGTPLPPSTTPPPSTPATQEPSDTGGRGLSVFEWIIILFGAMFLLGIAGLVVSLRARRQMRALQTQLAQPSATKPPPASAGFCSQCGTKLEEDTRFCPNCGAPTAPS
ncbi:MAG: zinc-ribbon domain-containing protein [Coprothermobacterota bacterium]|nr:zinc-ribbon domain-containing protein [Coprothermobacterota bacterium]